MESHIKKAYSAENFRRKGHDLIDQLADYLGDAQGASELPVFTRFDPTTLFDDWNERLRDSVVSFNDVAAKLIDDSIHLHHPQFMGHQVSPVLPEAALTELLSAVFNNGVGVYEMGSPTVAMERVVIKQLAGQLGFGEAADGVLTSGGTLGNLTALLAARQVKAPGDYWNEGSEDQQLGVMVSEEAHYCIERAAKIMGWGDGGIVKVPVDNRFRLNPNKLEEAYRQAKENGVEVIGVVGSGCSTATGAFDPLPEIAAFCQKHNLWFHVDAAHGGGATYSKKYNHLLQGIEQADSVIVDFHKMLMCPALVTGVVFKDGDHSYQAFAQKAKYLWDEEGKEWFNLGKRTFECTKDMMALKVYFTLQQYGVALWEEIIDTLFGLGSTFADLIKERDAFELAVDPQCNIVCFRHLPQNGNDINEHNKMLRKKLIDEGEFFIVQAQINGETYLRTALMNVHTTPNHLAGLLDRLEVIGQ